MKVLFNSARLILHSILSDGTYNYARVYAITIIDDGNKEVTIDKVEKLLYDYSFLDLSNN